MQNKRSEEKTKLEVRLAKQEVELLKRELKETGNELVCARKTLDAVIPRESMMANDQSMRQQSLDEEIKILQQELNREVQRSQNVEEEFRVLKTRLELAEKENRDLREKLLKKHGRITSDSITYSTETVPLKPKEKIKISQGSNQKNSMRVQLNHKTIHPMAILRQQRFSCNENQMQL